MNGRLFTLAAIVLIVALYNYVERRHPTTETATVNTANLPDYTMTRVEITTTGDSGAIHDKIEADELIHYPASDDEWQGRVELSQPRMEIFSQGGDTHWRLEATRGELFGRSRALLRDGVTITAVDPAAEGDAIITTSALEYRFHSQLLESEGAIKLRSPQMNLSAGGLQLDMRRDQITLHHGVHGKYHEP
ncbi:MAG: LPS export ABC transporter periplasmic protein LptC [Gammaproteobacteria bacterium]|nr:LPS export ABC transporter periplasmic protein LptC [Gammaproteobacteria bacterium]